MRAWRKEYGLELLQAIADEPNRVPSHYIKQFQKVRTAHVRHIDLYGEGLITVNEEPGSGRRTLNITDKGRKVLKLANKVEEVYWEGKE